MDFRVLTSKLEARYFRSQENCYGESILLRVDAKNSLEKQEDEIFLNGKLYDVVEKRIGTDSVYYYGMEDVNEEEAMNQLSKHFNNENSLSSFASIKLPNHVMSIGQISILFIFSTFNLHPIPENSISAFYDWEACCSTGFNSIQPRPPKNNSLAQLV